MFLWFTLVMFPMILLAGMMVTDFAATALAKDEAVALADASATAGAWEFVPQTALLNCPQSNGPAALYAATFAQRWGGGVNLQPGDRKVVYAADVQSVSATCTAGDGTAGNPGTVTVTINYTIPASDFYRSLIGVLGRGAVESHFFSVTRTAIVCIPGTTATSGGSCTRPQ